MMDRRAVMVTLCVSSACTLKNYGTPGPANDRLSFATTTRRVQRTSECATSLISGDGVGPIRVRASLDSVRRACPLARDTTMQVEYSTKPVRILSFPSGPDTIVASLIDGRVNQVEVSSRRFLTRDSVGVGTSLERLLRFPIARAHLYAGRLYLDDASHCGLVFELNAASVQLPESDLDSMELARLPSTIVVDRLRAQGCSEVPLTQGDTVTAVRTDSILLTKDLDGNGTLDYVVRESRLYDASFSSRAFRLAVYFDSLPSKRTAAWSSGWDRELGMETTLGQVDALGSDASVLVVGGGEGDYDFEILLVAQRGVVRRVLTHGEEDGQGFFDVSTHGDTLVVDASMDNLTAPGASLPSKINCTGESAAVRLTYYAKAQQFAAERPRCVKR